MNEVVHTTILIFAFRYAMGRNSYAPSLVSGEIKRNIDWFGTSQVQDMIREIDERDLTLLEYKTWKDLKYFLKGELERRKDSDKS